MKNIVTPSQARFVLDQRVHNAEGIITSGLPLAHGQVALANDSLFAEANPDIELTDYVVGYRDPANLEAEIQALFPGVEVPDRFSFRSFDNVEAFLADDGDTDVRALGQQFGEVEQYHNTETESRTINKGLCIRLDKDRVKNMPNWRTFYAGHLKQRLLRCELRRGVTLIGAAAVNTAKTWDATAGKDPDADINDQITSACDLSGIRPNSIYIGETAWNKRWASHRAQNSAGGFASASLDINALGANLGLPRRFRSDSRYQSTASAKAQFGGNKVWLYHALDSATEEDASNTKCFWTRCDNGERYKVWVIEQAKFWLIIVEHYSRPTITSALGIRQLTIS